MDEMQYYASASCGWAKLEDKRGLTFLGVEGEESGCGFYRPALSSMVVKNDATDGVSFKVAFERSFLEPYMEVFKFGAKKKLRAGFNIFSNFLDREPTDRGYSTDFVYQIDEVA